MYNISISYYNSINKLEWHLCLILRVYEIDPLKCPKSDGKMKIISFIEKRQAGITRLLDITGYGKISATEIHQ